MTAPQVDLTRGPDALFPKAMISLGDEQKTRFITWLGEQVEFLRVAHEEKVKQWAAEEESYRALPDAPKERPFVGACTDVIPAVAMAVDPIHARLDTGIFKSDRIIRVKALDKRLQDVLDPLERFIEYYWRHYLRIRTIASPRLLECAKHGHCVFRVEYENDRQPILTYTRDQASGQFKEAQRFLTTCVGPKITGIPVQNFIYPPRFQHIQDAPIVLEVVWMTEDQVRAEVKRGRMTNEKLLTPASGIGERTELDAAQEDSAQHHELQRSTPWVQLYRFCCKFDIDENGFQESLVGLWCHDTQTLHQLQYNWYHHQKYPYVLIPYTVTNGSIGGIGLCEMIQPFQRSMTAWHQQLWNNAYLANSRIIVRKREAVSTTEDSTAWYAGKEFYAEDPSKDVNIIAMADVHRSGGEMMNALMGYVEKRTGVSDYLTGRESPIVGSRATATSTVALIQEGTKRVEETLENLRVGFSEIAEMCIYIWHQYGTGGIEERIFDDADREKIVKFFDSLDRIDLGSSLHIELAATDASNNKAVQQQTQLALIQTFMVFYEKLITAAQGAVQASQLSPALAELIGQTMTDARQMFYDLANKYEVPDPGSYLPELDQFLATIGVSGARTPTALAGFGGPSQIPGMAGIPGQAPGPPGSVQAPGGGGSGTNGSVPAYA